MKELNKTEINKLGFLIFNDLLQKKQSLKVFTASTDESSKEKYKMFIEDLTKEIAMLKEIQKKLES